MDLSLRTEGFFYDMKPLLTITTDFGDQFASAQIQASAYLEGFEGKLVENHSVTPYSRIEGAFQMHVLARYCPDQSVHVGVVDPGVGSERWGVIIRTSSCWLVGPNNGLLYPLALRSGIRQVWRINEDEFHPSATTFHGRDIFIKAGVYLWQGKQPDQFGCIPVPLDCLETIHFIPGTVVHIDAYGNLKVYWEKRLHCGDFFGSVPVVTTFTDVQVGEPLAYWGSSDTLEIAVNQGSAARYFGVKLGDIIPLAL